MYPNVWREDTWCFGLKVYCSSLNLCRLQFYISKSTIPPVWHTTNVGKSNKIHMQTSFYTYGWVFAKMQVIQVSTKGSSFCPFVKFGITYPTVNRFQIQVSGKQWWCLPWAGNWGCSLAILWSSVEGPPERKNEEFHQSRRGEPCQWWQPSTGARGKASSKRGNGRV